MGKRWQNLIHGKCPSCDERLENRGRMFLCGTHGCGFLISAAKMADILTDPEHPAVRFASERERGIVDSALRELGIVLQ